MVSQESTFAAVGAAAAADGSGSCSDGGGSCGGVGCGCDFNDLVLQHVVLT